MKTILFSFEDLSNKEKIAAKAIKIFEKSLAQVVQVEVSAATKKQNGIAFRELYLTMADSQQVTFRIKESGDIFQVLLNNSLTPIKYQDDHGKAVVEIANKLTDGRAKFQKKMAAKETKVPASIKTAAPKLEVVLTQKRDELKTAVEDAEKELSELTAA